MVVKRLRPDDSQAAFEAIRVLKRPENSLAFTAEAVQRFLSRSENVLIVASSKSEPAGFLIAYLLDHIDQDQRMVCLYEIGVLESFRRRGVGRAMINLLKELCGEIKATKAWSITHRSNEAAMRLYQSTGAQPGPGGDDVTVVWKAENWRSGITSR